MAIESDVTKDLFRSAMSSWATGISVITGTATNGSEKPIGIVCNSLASISLEEKLILWSVDKSSSSYSHWISAKSFNVHFLAEDQKDLVSRFAKKGVDKFESLDFETTKLGNPILTGVSVRMECATTQTFDTHDHMLIIGKVLTLENYRKAPLLFLHSSLRTVQEIGIE
jgi:flavin reductase (DIM6/NTAB) family NADH-FMN oxidoreductase RutF